jgi:hypothetical protein
MVIEVFPTAALPHKTNLTAFLLAMGFCRTFDFSLSLGFSGFEKKHINKL